jgi:hypothetical protein
MKHSSLIYNAKGNELLNYYSSPVENCVSVIAMNQKISFTDVIGINCFYELLFRSELISYAKKYFSHNIKIGGILFYSKRLNLYVYKNN